jgi:hypothetical protein
MLEITPELKNLFLVIANNADLHVIIQNGILENLETRQGFKINDRLNKHFENSNIIKRIRDCNKIIKDLSEFNTWRKSFFENFPKNFQEFAEQFKQASAAAQENPANSTRILNQQSHIMYSEETIQSADYHYQDKILVGIKLFQKLAEKNIFGIQALKYSPVNNGYKYFAGKTTVNNGYKYFASKENIEIIKANLEQMSKLNNEILKLEAQRYIVLNILQNEKQISDDDIIDVDLTNFDLTNGYTNLPQAFKEAANNPNHFLHKTIKLIKIYKKSAESFEAEAKQAFPELKNEKIAKIEKLLATLHKAKKLNDWYEEPGIFEIICNFFAQIFCLGYVLTLKKAREDLQSGSSLSSI